MTSQSTEVSTTTFEFESCDLINLIRRRERRRIVMDRLMRHYVEFERLNRQREALRMVQDKTVLQRAKYTKSCCI